jgi:2-polyprenyl-3-methyl-5-hydroxy-6-metoxy-1,4-benzoquinol methylase
MTSDRPAAAEPCRLCGANDWGVLYHGPIREGRFGDVSAEPRTVLRCGRCGTGFLLATPAVDYADSAYRELVDGDASAERFYELHDAEQADKLSQLGLGGLRGKVVADVGCGAGSFLDLVRGMASATLGVEPTRSYHPVLRAKGHAVFSYCEDVPDDWRHRCDVVVCFSVVEHVPDPVALLRQIRTLLRPGGELVISTPNLRDWLLELLPEAYAPFFYRAVHTWYFDAGSLASLAATAGFQVSRIAHVHRFDLSNLLVWLRDRRPSGRAAIPVDAVVNAAMCRWLESVGRADYLYASFRI